MDFFDYVKGEAFILHKGTINIKELVIFLHKNKHITTLSLKGCQIGDEDVKELANSNLINLTSLNLSANSIGAEGAEALANSNLINLTSLNLSANSIGAEGAEALANSSLINLTSLNLSANSIGAKGAEALANSNLINLTSLNLLGNGIKVSDEGNFVDFSPRDAKDRTENGEGVLTKLRHRAEIMKESQEISNVQVSVQSNENQQMKAENDVTKSDGVAASVSSDDRRKRDSIQSAECVEQMDGRQVSLNQDNSQLTGNQQERLGSEGEELVADKVNNPAILSTANNSNPNKGIETSTLGQDNNTQSNNEQSNGFNKENDRQTEQQGNNICQASVVNGDSSQQVETEENNNKSYDQLLELLSAIEGDSDSNESNVIEKIKKKLEKEDPGAYQEWQNNQFDINYTFNNQFTLLHVASDGGLAKATKLLITKGADVDKTGQYGWTPLHYAIGRGFIEIVNILIEAGANINAVDESERTPLHCASCYGHVEIVNVLLYKGANFELKDKGGFTPLDYAADFKKQEVTYAINKFIVICERSLKLKHALYNYKNGVVSSGTFSDIDSDCTSVFSDDTDFSYTTETHEHDAITQDLDVVNKKVSQLEQAFATKSQEAEEVIYQLREKTRDLGVANKKVSQLEQAFATKSQEAEEVIYQLREKTQDLDVVNKKVSQLEQAFATKSQEAEEVIYQLREKTQDLDVVNKKVSQLEQELGSAQRELAAKTKKYESAQARSEELQKQLESKNEELNGKNEKFLRVSTHSKRQGKCASVFFVLSCAFTVGASLTIPYLATCVTLAIASSIFLAVGCYCSYKANTVLNNVEVDQVAKGANPVIV